MFLKSNNIFFRISFLTILFGVVLFANIIGKVFRDYNLNGIQDSLEIGVQDVNVTLYSDNKEMNSTLTDKNGNYSLKVPIGGYRIELNSIPYYLYIGRAINSLTQPFISMVESGEVYNIGLNNPADYLLKGHSFGDMIRVCTNSKVGWHLEDNICGGDILKRFNIHEGYNLLNKHFLGELEPIEMGDYVWEDKNGNGIQEPSEEGISGVVVKLFEGVNEVGIATTDEKGLFYFGGVNQTNMTIGSLKPYTDYQLRIALDSIGEREVTQKEIGKNGEIDSNGDNEILNEGFSTIAYRTRGAGESIHALDFGFKPSVDTDLDITPQREIENIEVSRNSLNQDVGLSLATKKASIGDFVWLDENQNGRQDKDEKGFANIVVKLLQECNSTSPIEIATTVTDSNGSYLFDGLDVGFYCLEFSAIPDLVNITLKNNSKNDKNDSDVIVLTGRTAITELTSGEVDLSWDMGLYHLSLAIIPHTVPIPTPSQPTGWDNSDENGFYNGEDEENSLPISTNQTSIKSLSSPTTTPVAKSYKRDNNISNSFSSSSTMTPPPPIIIKRNEIKSYKTQSLDKNRTEVKDKNNTIINTDTEMCEDLKIYNQSVEANKESSTTIINIFSDNVVALDTQTIYIVQIQEEEPIYTNGKAISTTNLIKSQTLRVEGEGVWEVDDGAIQFTAQDGFNGIPSLIHYVIEQSEDCINILGEEGKNSKIGEIRLTTPCICETYETKIEDSVEISNIMIIFMLVLTTAVAIFFVREDDMVSRR